jgi:hypothetical protein
LTSIIACDRLVDLVASHISFVAVFDIAARLQCQCHIDHANRRLVLQCGLAFEFGTDQIGPAFDRPTHQIGAYAEGVGVGDGRNAGQPFGRRAGECLAIGPGGIKHGIGCDPLGRRLAAVGIDAFAKERDYLIPVFVFGDRDRLQDVAPDQVFHEHDADVADIDRARLRQKPVQKIDVFGRLHLDREAEFLGCLLADLRDRRYGRARMEQGYVLDVLCPDHREPGQHSRSCREPGQCRAASQHTPARNSPSLQSRFFC